MTVTDTEITNFMGTDIHFVKTMLKPEKRKTLRFVEIQHSE